MNKLEGFRKGVNLGGWLSQCGNQYNEEHYSTFITEKDIAMVADWGVDHVRVPVDYNVIVTEDGEFIESGFAHIDDCVAWCRKYNLKMVFDIHKAKGFVFDNPDYAGFFGDSELQDFFVVMWKEIIRRYGKDGDMMAFELLNEVTERRFAEPWNAISKRTIAAIREIDKDATIIVGGIFNSSIYGLSLMEKPQDNNVVYTIHVYSPLVFTHQNAGWLDKMPEGYAIRYPGTVKEYAAESMKVFGDDFDADFQNLPSEVMDTSYFDKLFREALHYADNLGVTIYCGEYGVIDQAEPEDTLVWYRQINEIMEKYNIPRAAWTIKSMNFGLSDPHYAGVISELLKYL